MDGHGMGEVERHPYIQREERTPLPGAMWWAVVRRDDYTCQWCHMRSTNPEDLEVDHVIPYSAGGLDHTPNLRVLCVSCNQRRSNFATWEWQRPRPIVASCQGTTAEASQNRVTVFCVGHGALESVPDLPMKEMP